VLRFRKDSAEAYYFLAKASQGLANPTKQKLELEEALNIDRTFLADRVDLAAALLAARSPQADTP
jgi:hypothetical protein